MLFVSHLSAYSSDTSDFSQALVDQHSVNLSNLYIAAPFDPQTSLGDFLARVCDDSVFEDFEGVRLPGPTPSSKLLAGKATAGSSKRPVVSVPDDPPASAQSASVSVSPLCY